MFHHLKRINLWIHVHAVASIVGVVLFLFAPEASRIPLIVGASSYFYTVAFLDFGTVFTQMLIFWVQGLPLLILIFYILFLCKKNAIPYLIIVAIDTLSFWVRSSSPFAGSSRSMFGEGSFLLMYLSR